MQKVIFIVPIALFFLSCVTKAPTEKTSNNSSSKTVERSAQETPANGAALSDPTEGAGEGGGLSANPSAGTDKGYEMTPIDQLVVLGQEDTKLPVTVYTPAGYYLTGSGFSWGRLTEIRFKKDEAHSFSLNEIEGASTIAEAKKALIHKKGEHPNYRKVHKTLPDALILFYEKFGYRLFKFVEVDGLVYCLETTTSGFLAIDVVEQLYPHFSIIPEARTDTKASTLMQAIKDDDAVAIRRLIKEGLEISQLRGATPVKMAAIHNRVKIMNILLKNGGNANARDLYETSALHPAARLGHIAVVKLLIKKGADVNHADLAGTTPLMVAANGGHKEVVKLLLSKGADPSLKDANGRTAFIISLLTPHTEIVDILKTAPKPSKK